MSHGHKFWKLGPFASGAYGSDTGGHWNVLGLHRSWHAWPRPAGSPWNITTEFSLFGIFACKWNSDGFDWAFFGVEVKFKRARWRYGLRQQARDRRVSRKRLAKAMASALTGNTRATTEAK